MKKSEAEKLVCPFIYNNQNSDLGNDGGHISCITEKCMAWKFIQKPIHKAHESDEQKYYNTEEGYCQRLQKC